MIVYWIIIALLALPVVYLLALGLIGFPRATLLFIAAWIIIIGLAFGVAWFTRSSSDGRCWYEENASRIPVEVCE